MEQDIEQNPAIEQLHSENEPLDGNRQSGIITIVLTADNHLGHATFSQNPHKCEQGRQRLRHAFQQATDFAVGQGVDLFVQAGDLFDTTNPGEEDRSFVAERLAQLRQAGIRTFALGGLHDISVNAHLSPDAGISVGHVFPPQISYAHLGALHYLQPGGNARPASEQPGGSAVQGAYLEPVMVNVRGTLLGICGLGVLAGQEGDPLAHVRVDSDIERAAISLLVLHAPLESIAARLIAPTQVSNASIANQTTFRYILAGYHHSHHQLHIGQTDIVVAGATQHIDFSEPDAEPGFVFLGIAADGMRWCRHIPVDALKLRRLVINTAELWPQGSDAGDHTITDLILQRLEPLCSADAVVQLRLEGELTRNQYHQLDLNQVRHYGEERCFALLIDDSDLSFSSGESPLAAREANPTRVEERFSPREELVTLAEEWIAAAQDEQERQALQITKEELLAAFDAGVQGTRRK